MQIEASPIKVQETIERIAKLMEGDREPGTHISELIHCIRQSWLNRQTSGDGCENTATALPTPSMDGDGLPGQWIFSNSSPAPTLTMKSGLSPDKVLLFATGRAIQDYITGKPAEESERKLFVDGVHGTADYVDEQGFPWEIKATYASAARPIADTTHYFDQLAAYCCMLGVTKGYLAAFYINGYYDFQRKNPRPGAIPGERSTLQVYEVQFTEEELMDHWTRLMKRADILTSAATLAEIPVGLHYKWECGYCPFLNKQCAGGDALYRDHWK